MSDPTRISTHVLDTVTGEPARGVPVRLDRRDGDGRLHPRIPAAEWQPGGYRLVFEVQPYLGRDAFFPEITVAFHVADPDRHYHVPLLLSRYGYTTYRGS